MNGIIIVDGIVQRWAMGVPSLAEQDARVERARAMAADIAKRIGETPDVTEQKRLERLRANWLYVEEHAGPLKEHEVLVEAEPEEWPEAEVGAPLGWPRVKRGLVLAEAVDVVAGNTLRWGQLSEKDRNKVTELRQALLDLPETQPDPLLAWKAMLG